MILRKRFLMIDTIFSNDKLVNEIEIQYMTQKERQRITYVRFLE